jgi:hypothetical protein
VEAVIAGWVAGYGMAIASTLALTYLAWRSEGSPWLERLAAREMNPALLSVPIFLFATVAWTMIGLVAGSLYRLAGLDDDGWPGSGFYVVILGVAIAPLPALLLVWPRRWAMWLSMSLLFVALFGALMPALSSR